MLSIGLLKNKTKVSSQLNYHIKLIGCPHGQTDLGRIFSISSWKIRNAFSARRLVHLQMGKKEAYFLTKPFRLQIESIALGIFGKVWVPKILHEKIRTLQERSCDTLSKDTQKTIITPYSIA